MDEIKNKLTVKFNNNKKNLIWCLISVFIWGLAAHAFIFFNASFTHDSINEFNALAFGNDLRIQYGRVFVPLYRFIVKTNFALPWLTGFLALLWISLSLFLIVKTFKIESKTAIFILGGTMAVNLTVTGVAATFIHDLDCDMFALLLAVGAFFILTRYKNSFLLGSILICISLGLYQSYVSSAVTLIVIFSLNKLLQGEKAKGVLKYGGKGVLMIALGGFFYFLFSMFIPLFSNVEVATSGYNTIYKVRSIFSILRGLYESYKFSLTNLITFPNGYNSYFITALNLLILIGTLVMIFTLIVKKTKGAGAKVLSIVLILVLPWCMNISQILTGGAGHELMLYAVWFIYLLAFLALSMFTKEVNFKKSGFKTTIQVVSFAVVFIILWGNVQLSNTVYMKKDIECESNKILFTRILSHMEEADGYIAGETPVAFISRPRAVLQKIPDFDETYKVIGCESPFVIGAAHHSYYKAYFDYVLATPVKLTSEEKRMELWQSEEVLNMPAFPNYGCAQIVDGVLVVKLG